jgi:hypothetical protein
MDQLKPILEGNEDNIFVFFKASFSKLGIQLKSNGIWLPS